VVAFDHVYSVNRNELLKAIPRPEGRTEEEFTEMSGELLDRIVDMADNCGATDEHRALNWLFFRYEKVHAKHAEQAARNASLASISARPSSLGGGIVDVIFSYLRPSTDEVEKFRVSVDAKGPFPYLRTQLERYIDH
jgi:hypothetical protein